VNEETALLAAICAQPADDTTRLVYADWLDERGAPGDTERAEFVRVQVELACGQRRKSHNRRDCSFCLIGQCRTGKLETRERELKERLAPPVFFPEPLWGLWHSSKFGTESPAIVRRGFVESLACSAADWLRHADTLRRTQPVTRVKLTTYIYCSRAPKGLILTAGEEGSPPYQTSAERFPEVAGGHRAGMKLLMEQTWPGISFEMVEGTWGITSELPTSSAKPGIGGIAIA